MSKTGDLFAALAAPVLQCQNGETITHYPGGDLSAGVAIVGCLVTFDAEQGTNEESGDGAVTRDRSGDRERRTGILEVPYGTVLDPDDLFEIDGEQFTYVRTDARDTGDSATFRQLRITRHEPGVTALPKLRFNGLGGIRN